MTDYTLTRTQKNQVFTMMQALQLEPAEFRWDIWTESDEKHSKLAHISEDHYFKFGQQSSDLDAIWCECRPGAQTSVEYAYISVPSIMSTVNTWLGGVKRELSAPDLWGQLEAFSLTIPLDTQLALNAVPLLERDKERIRAALDESRDRAKTAHLSQPQLQVVYERLDYLVDSANRLTRKDWVMLALGVLATMALQAGIDIPSYKKIVEPIWQLIVSGLRLLT
ncbi:MAG: hypothetical protein ABFD92_07990 [Planctomycetaceae bacterium]|nr:hypothetical protein [Planctomycetaceae bacterium]